MSRDTPSPFLFYAPLTVLAALFLGLGVLPHLVPPPGSSGPGLFGSRAAPPSFADVAASVQPSVVSVIADSIVSQGSPIQGVERMRRMLEDPETDLEPPEVERETRGGTGVVLDRQGHIVTNWHVVEEADRIRVHIPGHPSYEARLVGADPETDLALLAVDSQADLVPARLADSDRIRVGEWALAVGDPLSFQRTVTVGVVSGTGRRIGEGLVSNYIQTDAAINVGNSGGPLLNIRGEVIGINTAISRVTSGPVYQTLVEGVGFAIPSNTVRRVASRLRESGRVARGFLGINIDVLPPEAGETFGLPGSGGVLVTRVREGWPADRAGLQEGDVIFRVEGTRVRSPDELIARVSDMDPGTTISLQVHRLGGERQTLQAELTDRGEAIGRSEEEQDVPWQNLSPEVIRLGFAVGEQEGTREGGAVVEIVDPLSRAWDQGLRPGAVVVNMQDTAIESASEFAGLLAEVEPGEVVHLLVRDGSWDSSPRHVFLRAR